MTIDHANDDDDMLDAVAADAFEPFEVLAGASMGNYRAAYSPHNVWLLCSADTNTLLDKLPHCSVHCKALYVHCAFVQYGRAVYRTGVEGRGKGQGGWL